MPTLRIDYVASTRRAHLEIDEQGIAWVQIRRACRAHSDDIQDLGPKSFSMDWRGFLNARKAIAYHVSKFGVSVALQPAARSFLHDAQSKQETYLEAFKAPTVKPEEIQAALNARGFIRDLTPEQLRNVSVLARLNAGATFSVPGAGKTTEALAFYFLRRTDKSKVLIVCPKNAFAVWEEQIRLCAPGLKVKVTRLTGGAENIDALFKAASEVGLMTYQQFPIVAEKIADFLSTHPTFLFLDESHKIKGGENRVIAGSILSVAHLPGAKLIMSGTPLPNSISDLVPQFSFLYPEVPADDESVSNLIKPVYVRTTKRELKIPPVTHLPRFVPLSAPQRRLYDLLRSELAREADKLLKRTERALLRSIGRSAIRLLQVSSNPMLLASSAVGHDALLSEILSDCDSPKIEYVCTRARELAVDGRKVVVWSSFVRNVELIASRLADLGADYIHGKVEAGSEEEEATREAKLKRFKEDPNAFVLVGNPAACGEGISLHEHCHYAIYLDRNFNAAQYLQSEDRIHRLGLAKDQVTTVEIVIAPNTIDESVHRRLIEKISRMGEVLNDPDLHPDPISFDLDDESLDKDDVKAVLEHLTEEEAASS